MRHYHAASRSYHLIWWALDLVYPPQCGGCGQPGSRWCPGCQQALPPILPPLCRKCGLPVRIPGLCSRCRAVRPEFDALRSWAIYASPLKEALHRLKYRRDLGLGEALARHMLEFVAGLAWKVDLLIPVPLGRLRLNQRGYNQVAMVALPLALALGVSYRPGALRRIRDTRSQVGLSARERIENLRGAFQAGAAVRERHVLLVDDIATTGATLSSAARALRLAGASSVQAVTIARALPIHGLSSV